jgi:hypothetical protein
MRLDQHPVFEQLHQLRSQATSGVVGSTTAPPC